MEGGGTVHHWRGHFTISIYGSTRQAGRPLFRADLTFVRSLTPFPFHPFPFTQIILARPLFPSFQVRQLSPFQATPCHPIGVAVAPVVPSATAAAAAVNPPRGFVLYTVKGGRLAWTDRKRRRR